MLSTLLYCCHSLLVLLQLITVKEHSIDEEQLTDFSTSICCKSRFSSSSNCCILLVWLNHHSLPLRINPLDCRLRIKLLLCPEVWESNEEVYYMETWNFSWTKSKKWPENFYCDRELISHFYKKCCTGKAAEKGAKVWLCYWKRNRLVSSL